MKQLDFSILPANNSHYSNLVDMILEMYKEEDVCDDMTPEKAEKIIHFLFSHPECGQIFIVQQTKTSQIVGYFILTFSYNVEYARPLLSIEDLYIRPAFRSRGLGSICMDFISDFGKKKEALLILEVSPGNLSAKELYLRKGFSIVQNSIFMRKLS